MPLLTIDAQGNSSSYQYDEHNNLIAMTDTQGYRTAYAYDGQNNLSAITDTLGNVSQYSYDNLGLVTLQRDANAHATEYGYDEIGQRVAITDAQANSSTFGYDDLGRLITTTNAAGQISLNQYDEAGHLVSSTNNYVPNQQGLNQPLSQNQPQEHVNLVTQYAYDGLGRQIALTDTLGKVTRHEYDDAGRLVRTIENYTSNPALGANEYNLVTTYGYDEVGRQDRVTDSLGYVSLTQYDAVGRIERTIANHQDGVYDSNLPDEDIITRFAYDSNGNLVSTRDVLGRESRTEYDTLNRVSRTIVNYQDGEYDATEPDRDIITTYQYDSAGNQIARADSLERVSQNFYDAANRLIRSIDPLSATSRYEYDGVGNQVVFTNAKGYTTSYGYDEVQRRIVMTDSYGQTTRYEYDSLGNQTLITNARGATLSYGYDTLNRLVMLTDSLGYTTTHTYDELGRRLTSSDANGRVTRHEYDSLGRILAVTRNFIEGGPVNEETNVPESLTYDALGRRLTVSDGNGHVTRLQYDGLGRTLAVTDALGNATTFTYDGLGNRLAVTNAAGERISNSYDGLNRLVSVTNALSQSTLYQYDGIGNRVAMTDAQDVQTCYSSDALNRLSSVTENCLVDLPSTNQQNVTTFYAYDALGNRTIITNGLGYTTTFAYDALNRLSAEADALGNTTRYAYDALGNRNVLTDANGAVTSFIYDLSNRLTTIDYPNGQSDVTFTYDRLGQRLTMQDESGTTTYLYDALNRLTSSTNGNNQTVGYAYDAVGNRTELSHPDSTVSYAYDDANRLATVQNQDGLYDYDYDDANRLTELSLPNGVTSEYDYDAAGQLIKLTHFSDTQTYAQYEYQLDGVGNRLAITETFEAGEELTKTLEANSLALELKNSFTSTAPLITGEEEMAYVGHSVANAGDINADGYNDLIVGAVGAKEGEAYLYLGGDNGLSSTSHWKSEDTQFDFRYGWSLNAGDLNGDGYSDVVIGIPHRGSADGRVELFYGGPNGLPQTPDWAYSSPEEDRLLGYSVASAGDINGDGYDDLLVGAKGVATKQLGLAHLFYGSATGLASDPDLTLESGKEDSFGQTVASAGDVNADGYDDVVIAAPATANYAGEVSLYLGSDNGLSPTPTQKRESDLKYARAGWSLTAGDINGDGYDDLVVGAPGWAVTEPVRGRIYLYFGSQEGYHEEPEIIVYPKVASLFGSSLTTADLNGDQYADIVVGAPGLYVEGVSGLIVLYEGGPTGLTLVASYKKDQPDGGQYGLAVAAVDTDNDSDDELFVGMPHFTGDSTYQGAIFEVGHNQEPQEELTTRTIQYSYDPLYRLLDATYSTSEQFSYTYDAVGNRLTMEVDSSTTTYTYDPANRLTQLDGTTYTYDPNGNLLADGTSTYTYDAANRLTSATDSSNTSTYLYDGLGNRLAQTTDGTTTQYTLDVAGGLPEVIAATTAGDTTSYLQIGGQLLAQQQSGTWQYMLPDHLGSVRQVVDADGNLIQSTSYTPFGEVMESEGGQQSAFGFTGEQRDETGLMFLRARYYEPGRGTFLSRDAWRGDTLRPQTFNPYGYVGGNPINIADPSGNCYGPLEWLRSLPIEDRNCIALDQSLHILGSGNYSDGDKRWAGAYVGGWTVSHAYLFVGIGLGGAKGATKLPALIGPARSAAQSARAMVNTVVRGGQSYLSSHPKVGNAIGIGMIAASTVDDISAVTLAISGDRDAAGQIVTIANSDPFAFNDFLAPVAVLAQRGSRAGGQVCQTLSGLSAQTQDLVRVAREAQQRIGRTPRGSPTYADVDGFQTRSGWGARDRYARTVSARDRALQLPDEDYQLFSHNRDRNFEGQYNSSHAERQAYEAIPNRPIGISNEYGVCSDCQRYFRGIAKNTGQFQAIGYPGNKVMIFNPDGRIAVVDAYDNVIIYPSGLFPGHP